MNVLIVRPPEVACSLAGAFRTSKTPGLAVSEYVRDEDFSRFVYTLKCMRWMVQPPPSIMVYPYVESEKESTLRAVSDLAARDNSVLVVLFPPPVSLPAEDIIRAQEAMLFERNSNLFILHNVDLDQPAKLAKVLIEIAQSGMFGRYRIDHDKVIPLRMKEPLCR